jgi:pyrimidine operon attenuation protein/uracil phosphoribosyltransferase
VGKTVEISADQQVDVLVNDLDGKDAVVITDREAQA